MIAKPLKQMKLGELAALYILMMRGIVTSEDYHIFDIQNMMEALAGDIETIVAIKDVRQEIDLQ